MQTRYWTKTQWTRRLAQATITRFRNPENPEMRKLSSQAASARKTNPNDRKRPRLFLQIALGVFDFFEGLDTLGFFNNFRLY